MMVLDTTVTSPKVGGSFVGEKIKDILKNQHQFEEYKKKFCKCWATGDPQKVEYHIHGEYMVALLIRQEDKVIVHEASGVDLSRRDETLFLLKRDAADLYQDMKRDVI